ncbi:hypothetical protein CAEBREN_29996 [Caenorhabditis brenneri]|uniref:Piwi domain-containing protein n=1 Tax=Caenorhabditis brenneri TaxID=135651 RepID=G0P263_CAEBE|nr:hypothetical protein CAEBREN_29996 [Caenorhabditis brenneri]
MQSGSSYNGRGGGGRGRGGGGQDRGQRDGGRDGRGSHRGGRGGGQARPNPYTNNSGRGGRGGGNNQEFSNRGREGSGSYRGGRGGYDRGNVPQDQQPSFGGQDGRGGYGGRGGNTGYSRGQSNRGNDVRSGRDANYNNDREGSYRGRGGGGHRGDRGLDNHSRPVTSNERCNGLLPNKNENMGDPSDMNQNSNPRLAINIFGLELSERRVFRHVVQSRLLDNKTKKDYILTTMSSRGRGNRASKQKDNFILLGKLLDEYAASKKEKKHPIFAYDGAQSLFSLEGISMVCEQNNCLYLFFFCRPSKSRRKMLFKSPGFQSNVFNCKSVFVHYFQREIFVTIQRSLRQHHAYGGTPREMGRRCERNTQRMPNRRKHSPIANLGARSYVYSIVCCDHVKFLAQSTQYYAPIPLNLMIQYAFPRDFPSNRLVSPNMRLQRAVKLLLKDLKCNPYYEDLQDWATNTITVTDVDYNAPKDSEYRQKYPNLKFPNLPAALCGMGQHKRPMPLEYLRVLPYQSIDRRVLEEFELTPRANAPNERWSTLQQHFDEFGFNDEVMQLFGVQICNDPFQNLSEIDGERVTAPKIAYADPVHVDDDKRDWKAQDKKFAKAATIDHLVFVLVAGYTRNFEADIKATEYVARSFMQRCNDKGMVIRNYEFRSWEGERESEHFLTRVFKDLVTHPKYRDSSFIPFVLLVSDDVPNIHECLKFEERMSDIPTQHILLKNIRKIRDNIEKKSQGGRRGYDLTLDNIVMKANIKCGGLNYTADVPRDLACWRDTPTFVMGMDVAHPDKTSVREGNPSTVGVSCLSCNSADHPYSFIGDFLFTDPRQEAIQDQILRKFTDQNVRNFAEIRGFPKKIIIFRDGVSFGEEKEAMREVEIIEQTIISAAKAMGLRDYAPKVLAIVVKKRHHTRFYARGGNQGDTPINPLPDTSVGGDIAEYGKRQIFIQAFRPVQGTAKVPSFLIIRDDEELTDEHITRMVCAVCSLHQLVNSPTSIPTPVYVAHELAKRGTGLFKCGELRDNWATLTDQLSYSTLDRLSKVRVV